MTFKISSMYVVKSSSRFREDTEERLNLRENDALRPSDFKVRQSKLRFVCRHITVRSLKNTMNN